MEKYGLTKIRMNFTLLVEVIVFVFVFRQPGSSRMA